MKEERTVADAILGTLLSKGHSKRAGTDLESGGELVVPVIAEEAEVRKRKVETGKVQIKKHITERTEVIDEPLLQEQVSVERVAVNRVVEAPMAIRYEGDIMIVPLLEEVVVVTKQLVLKEELRITRRQTTVRQPQQITLRREDALVLREANNKSKEVIPTPTITKNQKTDPRSYLPISGPLAAASQPPATKPKAAKKKSNTKKNKKKKG